MTPLLLLLSVLTPARSLVPAQAWVHDPSASTLAFRSAYQGEGFEGRFKVFRADIRFDPADPASGRFDVQIDLASADTGQTERDDTLKDTEFFDVASAREARFVATGCRAQADAIRCDGTLSLRGKDSAFPFVFRFVPQAEGRAHLSGTATVDRLAHDVGTGDWADPALIPREVEVRVELALARR